MKFVANYANRGPVSVEMQSNVQPLSSVPGWLSDRFLQEVIRKAKRDISITLCHDCKVRPGGKDGVRHASDLFRTTVHYRSKKIQREQAINLILKANRSKHDAQFKSEILMYQEILPAMEQVLAKNRESLEAPKFFYSSSDPQNLIVIEDLYPSGWVQRNCLNDFDDAKAVAAAIAKFHAASYISNGKLRFSTFYNPSFNKLQSAVDVFTNSLNSRSIDCQMAIKIQKLKPRVQEKLKQIYAPSHVAFNVLNHGDLNLSNLWFKTRTGYKTAAMIDFQRCHWGSPAIDLLSLLDLILDPKLRVTHSDRLVSEYYHSLVGYLTQIGLRRPPIGLPDLVQELKRCEFLEFVHLAMENANKTDSFEINNRLAAENNEKEIQQELKRMMERGIFD